MASSNSIYRGILTGYNKAFIVDQATRDGLIAADPRSEELLKPILRGRDIARYRAKWAGLWLISTFPSLSLEIEDYPAVKSHLLTFGKERLAQSGNKLPDGGRARKKTSHQWFELQDTCAYHEQFDAEKVVWIELVDKGRFAFDDSGMHTEATTFILCGEAVKYLCGFLNSSLAHWYILNTAPTSGMGVSRWKKVYVESMPVSPCDATSATQMHELVDVARSSDESEFFRIDREIDGLVYHAFDITTEERKVIENATRS